jgi:hypothetical protein
MSTSSSSSFASSDSNLTASEELGNLLFDEPMADLCNEVFFTTPEHINNLRLYQLTVQTIRRLEYDLEQYQQMRREFFDEMWTSEEFRQKIRPIVNTYRRRMRQTAPHPYARRQPSPSSPSYLDLPNTQWVSYSRRRRDTPIPSPSPSQSSSSTTSGSYHSAHSSTSGTREDPIDVDGSEGPSLPQIATPTCPRCKQVGHLRPNCDTKMRSFTFCDVCDWLKQDQSACLHYDFSPADITRLRSNNIPYDDSSD